MSCAPVTCRSMDDGLRFGVMFDAMPRNELFGRYSRQINERMWRQGGSSVRPQRTGMAAAAAAAAAAAVAAVEERMRRSNNVATICSDCKPRHEPIELSKDHYPNVLPGVTCSGGQWCKKFVYPVQVLKRKKAFESDLEESRKIFPQELVQNWRFVQINVTVACSCPN